MDEASIITISTDEVTSPISCDGNCVTSKQWTFKTTEELRVRVVFREFVFSESYEYLEMGDGLIVREDTRLAHFTGIYLPSNVTSITSAAWIAVYFKCGEIISSFNITITSISNSGTHPVKFDMVLNKFGMSFIVYLFVKEQNTFQIVLFNFKIS